jgi:hypothetical protein
MVAACWAERNDARERSRGERGATTDFGGWAEGKHNAGRKGCLGSYDRPWFDGLLANLGQTRGKAGGAKENSFAFLFFKRKSLKLNSNLNLNSSNHKQCSSMNATHNKPQT